MKSYLLFSVLLALTGWTYAQGPGSIENIDVTQRSGEEERVVDIAFTLSGGDYYAIKLDVKFQEGDDFTPIQADEIMGLDSDDIIDTHLDETIIGAIIVEAGEVELTWDGRENYAEIDAAAARVEITAARGLKDIDGNFYKTVLIGDQEWMAENLRVTKYNDGEPILTGLNDTDWANTVSGTYAIYPHGDIAGLNSDEDVLEAYGALYNWYAVNTGNLCPADWRVPSHDDWTQLERYICNELVNSDCATQFPDDITTIGWRGTNEGNALKSCRQVGSPLGGNCITSTHPRWDSDDTHHGFDEFGFSALPGGSRWSYGSFGSLGTLGIWWSSTEGSSAGAWGRGMSRYNGTVARNGYNKASGFSLRCVRDPG